MNTTMTGAAATYLAQVRAELADLPASELEEVLDDVAGHLEEISRELDGEPTMPALEARIGSPQQYAEELRTAAGYPPKSAAGRGKNPGTAPLRWGMAAVAATPFLIWLGAALSDWSPIASLFVLALLALCPIRGVRALRGRDPRIVTTTPLWQRGEAWLRRRADRLPAGVRRDLVAIGQPVWWVARGVAGGALLVWPLGAIGGPVTVIAGILGAVASVWVGRRSQQDRRWLWFLVPANIVGAIAVLIVVIGLGSWSTSYASDGPDGYGPSAAHGSGLTHDGRPVANVFPFDQRGKPLRDVRLYDENGRPLTVSLDRCPVPPDSAMMPSEQNNVFPNLTVTYSDWDGTCRESMGPTFVVPPLPTRSPSTPAATSR